MKTMAIELTLHRWPYSLEVHPSANGLLIRPRHKARANWSKAFRHPPIIADELTPMRCLHHDFDVKEWEW
jgi:hypothetical protein